MENDKNNLMNLYSKLYNQTQNYIYEVSLVDINGASDFVLTRDNVSKTLRDISIKIHNKFEDYEKAFEVIECAIEVAGTSYQENKILRKMKRFVKSISIHGERIIQPQLLFKVPEIVG